MESKREKRTALRQQITVVAHNLAHAKNQGKSQNSLASYKGQITKLQKEIDKLS